MSDGLQIKKSGFTVKWVQGVSAPEKRQKDYWDRLIPGFGLRVSPKGKKTWMVVYRHMGKQRRQVLGTYPELSLKEARDLAFEIRRKLVRNQNPHDVGDKPESNSADGIAVKELCHEYMERHARPNKKSWRADLQIIEKDVIPNWGALPASSIRKRDVIRVIDQVIDRGSPIQANRVLSLISKVFNFAIERDIISSSPTFKVKKPSKETAWDRVLSEKEIRAVWAASNKEEDIRGEIYFKLRILSAQRGREILTAEWSEVDLDRGWWTKPGRKVKNGLSHQVPITEEMRELFLELKRKFPQSRWVFPSPTVKDQPIVEVKKVYRRIKKESGVDFMGRDLRRTAATHLRQMGIDRLTVKRILNHKDQDITAVYDRYACDKEKKAALEAWNKRVIEVVEGRWKNNVVGFG